MRNLLCGVLAAVLVAAAALSCSSRSTIPVVTHPATASATPVVATSTVPVMATITLPSSTVSRTPSTTVSPSPTASTPTSSLAPRYTYRIIRSYPHDPAAFTEGLVYQDGYLHEGTGLNGRSWLRRVDLTSGKVLQQRDLPAEYFGEGIALFGDQIFQLTWQSHVGFVYQQEDFAPVRSFSYPTEGWGLTQDGRRLIMSDGTASLHFLDPVTLNVTSTVQVKDKGQPVQNINELEYINGRVFANIWLTDLIAVIDPSDGQVLSWLDLSGLLDRQKYPNVDVLNGIAYDEAGKRLFVTGKFWPLLFEIELAPAA